MNNIGALFYEIEYKAYQAIEILEYGDFSFHRDMIDFDIVIFAQLF